MDAKGSGNTGKEIALSESARNRNPRKLRQQKGTTTSVDRKPEIVIKMGRVSEPISSSETRPILMTTSSLRSTLVSKILHSVMYANSFLNTVDVSVGRSSLHK